MIRYLPRTRSYKFSLVSIHLTLVLFGLTHCIFDVAPYLVRTTHGLLHGFPAPLSCLVTSEWEGCATLHPDQQRAAWYLRDHTTADEPILSANPRYDQIYFQNMMIYSLAGRVPPTRHHDLLSGLATTLPVQQQIAQALEAHPVRYIAVYHGYDRWEEDSPASLSSGVKYLDGVIRAQCAEAERFGDYMILQWKGQ